MQVVNYEKTLRLFNLREAGVILDIGPRTLSQWLSRKQFVVSDHPQRDDYRFSYYDLLRMMLIDYLGETFGIPVSHADRMVSELRDGVAGVRMEADGAGGRHATQAEIMIVLDADGEKGQKPKYAWVEDKEAEKAADPTIASSRLDKIVQKLQSRNAALVAIRLDKAILELDEKISAAEAKAGRELGSRIK